MGKYDIRYNVNRVISVVSDKRLNETGIFYKHYDFYILLDGNKNKNEEYVMSIADYKQSTIITAPDHTKPIINPNSSIVSQYENTTKLHDKEITKDWQAEFKNPNNPLNFHYQELMETAKDEGYGLITVTRDDLYMFETAVNQKCEQLAHIKLDEQTNEQGMRQ